MALPLAILSRVTYPAWVTTCPALTFATPSSRLSFAILTARLPLVGAFPRTIVRRVRSARWSFITLSLPWKGDALSWAALVALSLRSRALTARE